MNKINKIDVKGIPFRPIVRIRPATNFQRQDLRLNGNAILLTDPNNRILEEFQFAQDNIAFPEQTQLIDIFNARIADTVDNFIDGMNISIFAYGSTGAGKTQTIEGNKKEFGVIQLYAELLNEKLERLKQEPKHTNHKWSIKIQYVEVIDENISDLLRKVKTGVKLIIEDDIWNGPIIKDAWQTYEDDPKTRGLNQFIKQSLESGQKFRDNTSDEFGKVTAKSTSIFIIDFDQQYDLDDVTQTLRSQVSFYDLPGSEILVSDAETIRIKQGSTLNKVIIAFSQLLSDLANRQEDYVMYDTSTATKLCKERIGANAINIGIFCLQSGDPNGSSLTLKRFKDSSKIQSFPVINNDTVLGLFRQFRQEASSSSQAKKNQENQYANTNNVQEVLDLKRQNLDFQKLIAEQDEELQDYKKKIYDLRQRFNRLVEEKVNLQNELLQSEEDKIESARALLELEIERERILKQLQEERLNANRHVLNNDNISNSMKEQQAQELIKELQERLKEAFQDRSDIDMEMMALRKNYHEKLKELEQERIKQENYSLELINTVNENKALNEEITKMHQKNGSTSDDYKLLVQRLEKIQADLDQKDEALVFAKTEIERLKVELMRFDVLGNQGKHLLDKKAFELDKSKIAGVPPILNNDDDENLKNDRMIWESHKMELNHKVKSLQRRVNQDNERIKELEKQLQELIGENTKMQLQLDEMRAIYRNKLMQIHKIDPRDELFQTYSTKEKELSDALEFMKRKNKQLNLELRSLKSYSRNLRYLAEDWAPVGQPLPDLLQIDNPMLDEEELVTQLSRDQELEIKRLRNKNHTLEVENIGLKERMNKENKLDSSQRLIHEINNLKKSNLDDTDSSFRKERNDLQEENRKLVQYLKDAGKWDMVSLQKDNERLSKMIKEYEMIGPTSGQSKSVTQKINFYEQLVRQLEREKTEQLVKATVAEEQLITKNRYNY
ncbi:protein of unknown function (DUF4472) [Paramecium bursaria]